MIARVISGAVLGIQAYPVEVEVDVASGLPAYAMVGLGAEAVLEGRVRIRAAIANAGFRLPPRRITVNLAPADVRKEGASLDLPVAVATLAACGLLPGERLPGLLFLGELGLDGAIKPVRGVLPAAALARERGLAGVVVPRANAREAALVDGLAVHGADDLRQVAAFLAGEGELSPCEPAVAERPAPPVQPDLEDVRGQEHAKRALEIAAAGAHAVLLVGPPGAGKTMLARRIAGILPPLVFEEALECTKIYSVAGLLDGTPLVDVRPFRAPHHSVSPAGLIGGGPGVRPGEITLAHNGVLFLDELAEFGRPALEALRQPLEERAVTLVRARRAIRYPAAFMLVAAANPCACGYHGSRRTCVCSAGSLDRYRARLSGPLLDRIDLQVEVPAVSYRDLAAEKPGESTAEVSKRVLEARRRQLQRLASSGLRANGEMPPALARRLCPLDADSHGLLRRAVERLGISARAADRIVKIARTIADLGGSDRIAAVHVAEAMQYRALDRPLA